MKSIRLLILVFPLSVFAQPGQKADPVRAAHKAPAAVSGQLPAPGLERPVDAKDLLDLAPLSRPGDEYTVNATGAYGDSWEQVSGASYREILDTSDWDQSVAVNTPGQSGQPGSPHYSDLLPLWNAGRYFPLLYSRKAVEDETTDRLVLEP
ncbi:MAG: penicillin acylase family protein [Terriglobales bacterium]